MDTKKMVILTLILVAIACAPKLPAPAAGEGAVEWDFGQLRKWYSRPPAQWPAPTLEKEVAHVELGKLPPVPYPDDNPYSAAKATLGRQLFFDPRMSVSNQIACATCHDPELGWGDGRKNSFGHNRQQGRRNAPTLLNAGHWKILFWDGRAASLEEQVAFPIQDHLEMNQDIPGLLAKLNAIPGYRQQFRDVFQADSITFDLVAKAIATFERRIVSYTSRFDLFLDGKYEALSDQALLGLHLFRTKAGCMNCHHGPLFSDQKFHNDGFTFFGRPDEDLGLYVLSKKPEDVGRFRTASLRDVAFTAPWMHTGTMQNLDEIIFMYNQGMPQPIPQKYLDDPRPKPVTSHLLKPLRLTETERQALRAFLEAISARPGPLRIPELPM
jgi:cytochrome c peroxidase